MVPSSCGRKLLKDFVNRYLNRLLMKVIQSASFLRGSSLCHCNLLRIILLELKLFLFCFKFRHNPRQTMSFYEQVKYLIYFNKSILTYFVKEKLLFEYILGLIFFSIYFNNLFVSTCNFAWILVSTGKVQIENQFFMILKFNLTKDINH